MGERLDDDFRAISGGRLLYVLRMLRGTRDEMRSGIPSGLIGTALLDSFALHARSLIHFFYPKRLRSDDVLAEEFFDDPETWRSKRPAEPDELHKTRKRVNKQTAHLTWTFLTLSEVRRYARRRSGSSNLHPRSA